jgi:hypothetical protein
VVTDALYYRQTASSPFTPPSTDGTPWLHLTIKAFKRTPVENGKTKHFDWATIHAPEPNGAVFEIGYRCVKAWRGVDMLDKCKGPVDIIHIGIPHGKVCF